LVFNVSSVPPSSGPGSGLIAEGLESIQITDLNFDPTILGLQNGETRAYYTNSTPSNPFFGTTGFYQLFLTKESATEYRLLADNGQTHFGRAYSSGWGSPSVIGSPALISLTTGSSPYAVLNTVSHDVVHRISATTNPYIVNLYASTGSGRRLTFINTSALATGLIKIVPATGEKIGPLAANVACYLQNVDQSGWLFTQKYLILVDAGIGQWDVVGGQFQPEPGSLDAAGTQYYLGKLIRLPLGNTTAAGTISLNGVLPAVGAFGVGIQVSGAGGIPTGAKAVRARFILNAFATAAGIATISFSVSDNNSSVPTASTRHPFFSHDYYRAASGLANRGTVLETDLPLDTNGKIYLYGIDLTNVTLASTTCLFTVLGYYMGD
jgi:hypothetical protein